MSDDWGGHGRDADDEEEKDEPELGGDEPGGWAAEAPDGGHTHWVDDEPEPEGESPSGWPDPGPTWQRSDYREAPSGWQGSGESDYDEYGYRRRDDLDSDGNQADRYESQHTRDPLARLFPSLPRSVRVTLDWILTIAGAILIVLALKHWVVNPYRIPSSSMEPTLNCAKGFANPGCLGDSSDRVLACRICLDFGHNPSRGGFPVRSPKVRVSSRASPRSGVGGSSIRTTRAPPTSTAGWFQRCCSRAITDASMPGGGSR